MTTLCVNVSKTPTHGEISAARAGVIIMKTILEPENKKLSDKLKQAETIIGVQKNIRDPGHTSKQKRRDEPMGAVL